MVPSIYPQAAMVEANTTIKQLRDELVIANGRKEDLRAILLVLLDQVDYTAGNCRLNEMVGAALPREIIVLARKALQETTDVKV